MAQIPFMIVSASYRTDIPAFHAAWFQTCFAAGEAWVKNPYSGKPYRVSLSPDDVTGFVFWTRNLAPFADALLQVEAARLPYIVQYTATGYPKALEAGVPPADHGIRQLAALANRQGKGAGVWRYDPVLFSSLTPPEWHRANFATLAQALRPHVDEVTVSFCQIYAKTARNLKQAAGQHGFTWRDPPPDERRAFLADMAQIAGDHGLRLTVCSQPDLVAEPEISAAACIDAARLSRVAGYAIPAKTKGNRPGCLCAESRDLGAYDSCAHGCCYCYAVRDHDRAKANLQSERAHPSHGKA